MTPSTLRECSFKISYGPADDRLNGFYIPALSVSVRYDRAAGFFSSTALSVAAQGIAKLIQNGGRMRLLVGAELSEDDVEAIRRGAEVGEIVSGRMLAALTDPADEIQRNRLEALAWMVADGTLEMRVVLPRGADGRPLPAGEAADYFHPKEGVFTDAAGDQVAFSGSVNETAQGWERNYEQFMVYRSWDESRPYLRQVVWRFERLWHGQERDWMALTVPQAVREGLLRYRPAEAPRRDPLERVAAEAPAPYGTALDASQRERVIAQFLRDAPKLVDAGDLPTLTSAVRPWPHQVETVRDVVERYPQSFLLCDEVGLGKTIEAALILRHLYLTGLVRRCLVLAPKSVTRQWQEELYEKAALNVALYDGLALRDYFGAELPVDAANPFGSAPLLIASSQMAKRRDRREALLSADPWDLVIVDEAHHARRRTFERNSYRPNRMLELLERLKDHSRCMLLLTATPMQISPVEVWDLLTLLGVGGKWGASEQAFLRFFQELQREPEQRDWDFLAEMFREFRDEGGRLDPQFEQIARARVGEAEWDAIVRLVNGGGRASTARALTPAGRAVATELLRRHTPLALYMRRNTRERLRRYQQAGLLADTIPTRNPRPVWIDMKPDERALYDRVEEYIADVYQRYEAQRPGLGFVMTVYRRRLTSSFYALRRSLERRLAFLRGGGTPFDDDDVEQADLELDVAEEDQAERWSFCEEENYIRDYLHEIDRLQGDSKFERLCEDLRALLQRFDRVVVFTQYTDTMDYLRDQLKDVYGRGVGCYSGRGGELWNGMAWLPADKEEVKRRFGAGELQVLVCTEAASEGINLQTCGVLINYDMPWNPMRVEQRIGRIDRIGQTYQEVQIYHYFYEGTVEEQVYRALGDRIHWFREIVGTLQPILSRARLAIERAAMQRKEHRKRILEEELQQLRDQLDRQREEGLDLDAALDREPAAPESRQTRLGLEELERTLTSMSCLQDTLVPADGSDGVYRLVARDGAEHNVTFRPDVFDEHPNRVRLMTFGSDAFEWLLSSIPAPEESTEGSVCRVQASTGSVDVVGYIHPDGSLAATPSELAENGPGANDTGSLGEAERRIEEGARSRANALRAAEERRHAALRRRLEAKARELLARAAAMRRALQGHEHETARSIDPVEALAAEGYPWAGLLTLVGPGSVVVGQPLLAECAQGSKASLQSGLSSERERAKQLLERLAAPPAGSAAEDEPVVIERTWYRLD